MADTLTYLGSLSTGGIAPALGVAVSIAKPKIQAELAGQLSAQVAVTVTPPSIAASLLLAQQLVAGIQAAIAAGVEVPSASVQLTAIGDAIAALNVLLGLLAFPLDAAGIHAFAYDGTATGLGPSLPSAMPDGAPGDHVNALVLATSIPASWVALGAILKTSA